MSYKESEAYLAIKAESPQRLHALDKWILKHKAVDDYKAYKYYKVEYKYNEISDKTYTDLSLEAFEELDDYDSQASHFLAMTDTILSVELIAHKHYFSDDKYKRDVYKCTLTRANRSYTFDFDQSIEESAREAQEDIIAKGTYGKNSCYTFERLIPKPYDILACLSLDYDLIDVTDLGKACDIVASNYGYAAPSICIDVTKKLLENNDYLQKLYSDDELEYLHRIS